MKKLNPYSHQINTVNPIQKQAREDNTFQILNEIAKQSKSTKESFGQPMVEQSPQRIKNQPQPLPRPEEMDAMAFDKEGNFIKPPIEGFWLGVLERLNKNDPYKQGKDWRDEAITKLKSVKMELNAMKAEIYSATPQPIPSVMQRKMPENKPLRKGVRRQAIDKLGLKGGIMV